MIFSVDAWIMQIYLSFNTILEETKFQLGGGRTGVGGTEVWEGQLIPAPRKITPLQKHKDPFKLISRVCLPIEPTIKSVNFVKQDLNKK